MFGFLLGGLSFLISKSFCTINTAVVDTQGEHSIDKNRGWQSFLYDISVHRRARNWVVSDGVLLAVTVTLYCSLNCGEPLDSTA